MKRFLILLSILFCNTIYADTINLYWLNYDGTIYQNSTCTVDNDLIVPSTPPTKYGYTFSGWEPANYIPIEYIESTGTQYIDTGVIVNSQNMKFVTRVKNLSVTVDVIFGCADTSAGYPGVLVNQVGSFRYGNSTLRQLSPNLDTTTVYDLELSWKKLVVNGTTYTSEATTSWNDQRTRSLYIFARNEPGETFHFARMQLYSFKIYDNDNLVRDFIPVLDLNGTPCMFDRVTGQFFYNQGTGQFTAGPVLNE